ncbi:hypothetical protein F4782DRAFT_520142 [Xylaria castorea]|nr:hypothetical protein F4782DRAFT_520142 [Xylaria castorea]
MYDIMAADPSLIDELRTEIETVTVDANGWSDMPYNRLHKLDSTLRESQRTSPTTLLGMKRLSRSHISSVMAFIFPRARTRP